MAVQVQVVFDCSQPAELSRFWADALGYEIDQPPPGFDTWEAFLADAGVPEDEWDSASAASDPEGVGPRLFFQQVPEAKQVKNRVHLDVNVGGPRGTPEDERWTRIETARDRLVELGATAVEARSDRFSRWFVMLDPEGNEFCLQ